MENKLISVIVPVYNVEKYLRQCLDSILAQTYRNLEILLIDDGSPDRCGQICDEYAEKDPRVTVFHTPNRGLSAARNLGIEHAHGDYIGFVDSDDWIEPDMYEVLWKRAQETEADIVECGVIEHDRIRNRQNLTFTGREAVIALLREELSDNVWNKLWKRSCFDDVRFPENRVFEDIVTTYRIFQASNMVASVNVTKYHYQKRNESISCSHDMKNLVDYWLAHYERYRALKDEVGSESHLDLYKCCATAAARAWAYFDGCSLAERESASEDFHNMNAFVKQNIPLFGYKGWKSVLRFGVFFPHYLNALSFRLAWVLNSFH